MQDNKTLIQDAISNLKNCVNSLIDALNVNNTSRVVDRDDIKGIIDDCVENIRILNDLDVMRSAHEK